jgi:hypothetical protein
MNETGYYIDRLRINSKRKVQELKKTFKVQGIQVIRAYRKAMGWGFRSRLDLIAPTKEVLTVIHENESKIHPYKISYLEIAKDTFQRTLRKADVLVSRNIGLLDRRWSRESYKYDQKYENYKKYKKRKPDLGTRTIYIGQKNFKYVQYARPSKINQRPCVHEEFRILGAKRIRQKTGISCIADLIPFDSEQFFERDYAKLITSKTIDKEKLGRWLAGIDGRRKKLTRQEKIKCQIRVRHFCSTYEIETFNDLKKELSRLNKEIREHPGAKNEFQKRVLALKGNYRRLQRK